jgi:hypothetical protein
MMPLGHAGSVDLGSATGQRASRVTRNGFRPRATPSAAQQRTARSVQEDTCYVGPRIERPWRPDYRATGAPAVARPHDRAADQETVRYRALVRYLVSSSLRTESAGTVFGYLWWLLDPLLLMPAYVVLVDVVLQSGGEDFWSLF